MSLARVDTFALDGVEARRVWVEADIRSGLPAFAVVGLADKAVREARERVRAAIVNPGYVFPRRADHSQPRTGLLAQGRARGSTCPSRSRSWPRAARSPPRPSRAAPCSASCR